MASDNRSAFRAGLFIVIGVILIVTIIVSIKGAGHLVMPNQHRTVTFKLTDDVGGLNVGDDVRIGGYKVGVVEDIDVAGLDTGEREPPTIVVDFAMPRKYVLREGASIGIQGTVTGVSWLNIDSLGVGQPIAQGVTLNGRPSHLSTAFASISGIGNDLRALVADVKTTTLPKINNTLDTFKQTGTTGTEALANARDLLGDTKTDFRGTMSNLNASTGKLKEKLPGILDKVDGTLAKLDGTVEDARAALQDIKASMANAKELTAAAKQVVVGNKGKLDGIIASLKATSDNLKNASAEIRRSPWRLIYKPGPGDEQNLQLYDSARQFADGANKLNDAALALRDAMQNPQIDKTQVQQLMDKLDQSFANFGDVEAKLWKSVKE